MLEKEQFETHLFIIWENARYKEDEIIKDLNNKFKILDIFEVTWSKERFSENLSRFYGEKLPNGSFKEKHCGNGPFLLIVVEDTNPSYKSRETSRGEEKVNANTFDAKTKYREWTGGGHKFHGTNSLIETNHDLTLLIGKNVEDYRTNSKDFTGEILKYNEDLVGANGWGDIKQLFYVLNNTINYVVLRNFECLPIEYNTRDHGDIDLLTDNYNDMKWILNGEKVFNQKYRVHFQVPIQESIVLFDIRYINDNYYDIVWQKNILKNRKFKDESLYIPDSRNYFYSLLYHAIVHKTDIAPDYSKKLYDMSKELKIDNKKEYSFENQSKLKELLDRFMNNEGYKYTEPDDLSVYYNYKLIDSKISLKRNINENLIFSIRKTLSPLKKVLMK